MTQVSSTQSLSENKKEAPSGNLSGLELQGKSSSVLVGELTSRLLDLPKNVSGVSKVETPVKVDDAKQIILHLRQIHSVLPEQLIAAFQSNNNETLDSKTKDSIVALTMYKNQQVALCQEEIVQALRYLNKEHGINDCYLEGLNTSLTTEELVSYRDRMKANYLTLQEGVQNHETTLGNVNELRKKAEYQNGPRKIVLDYIEANKQKELLEYKDKLNRMDAAYKAYAQGAINDIHPMSSEELDKKADKMIRGVEAGSFENLSESREDFAISSVVSPDRRISVVIFGADHDLVNNVNTWNANNPGNKLNLVVVTPNEVQKPKDSQEETKAREEFIKKYLKIQSIIETHPAIIEELKKKK